MSNSYANSPSIGRCNSPPVHWANPKGGWGWAASLRGRGGAAPTALRLPCPSYRSGSQMYFSGWAVASSLLYAARGSDILGEGAQRWTPDQRGAAETQAAALGGRNFLAQCNEI